MKKLISFLIITSFLGSAFLSINLGFAQLTLFRITLSILIVVVLIRISYSHNLKELINSYEIKFFFIWFVYDIITGFWVKDYEAWFKSVFFIGIGVISVFVMVSLLRKSKDFMLVFRSVEFTSIIFSIVGWYEVLTGKYLFSVSANSEYINFLELANKNIPIFITANENEFALILLFTFFISYICLVNKKRRMDKFLSVLIMVSSFVLIMVTQSRGIILSLFLGLLPLIWMQIKLFKLNWQKKAYRVFSLFSILFIISLLVVLWNIGTIKIMIGGTNSDSIRFQLIIEGIRFLKETYFLGVGGGNIEYWMSNYTNLPIINIHNWWMEILTSFGIIIFVLYITLYYSLIKKFFKLYKTSSSIFQISTSIAFISFMISFIIAGMVSSSLLDNEWLWLFFGILAAFLKFSKKEYKIDYNSENDKRIIPSSVLS